MLSKGLAYCQQDLWRELEKGHIKKMDQGKRHTWRWSY